MIDHPPEPSVRTEPPPTPAAPTTGVRGLGRRFFLVRGWIYLPLVAAALLLHVGETGRPEILWPAGAALVLAGVGLRFSAIRRIGGAARTKKHKAKRLIDSGPYAWTRNPLYVANTAAFVGFVLLCDLPWFAGATALFLFGWYHVIARYEETVLEQLFGAEFAEYRKRVPLWVPLPPRNPPAEDPADLYPVGKLLRRERGALMNVAVMVALAAGKQWIWN